MTKRIGVCFLVFLVACSASGTARQPFDDSADSTTPPNGTPPPAQTTDQAPTPPPQPAPPPPPGDDGGTDAGTCKTATATSKCGLDPQCGCTSVETCDVTDSAGNAACITAGTAAMGKTCTTTAGCAKGLTCVFGTCHAFCSDTSSACSTAGTGACINVQNSGGMGVPNYDVCLVKCDLRDANACGGTTAAGTGACVVDDKGNTDCEKTTGNLTVNQTCTGNDCGPGLVCVSVTSGSTTTSSCKSWCQVGTSDCGSGKTCGGFGTKVIVDGKEYGACP